MKYKLGVLLLSAGFLILMGCQHSSRLSPQQRRALQVKHFKDSSYDHVFRAFKSVLQDEGYIIRNQDMQGGLIVARASKGASATSAFLAALAGSQNYRTGDMYEVSVNLEEIRKNYVESRVIIQRVSSYSQGGQSGQEILSPELYRNIYAKVFTEVARRKAQGK